MPKQPRPDPYKAKRHKFYGAAAVVAAFDALAEEEAKAGGPDDTRSKQMGKAHLLFLRRADKMAKLRKAGFKQIDEIVGPLKR